MLGAFVVTTSPGRQKAKLRLFILKKYYLKFYSEVCALISLLYIQKVFGSHTILGTERPKREANLTIVYYGGTKQEMLCLFLNSF
jgi:hypothetical protein